MVKKLLVEGWRGINHSYAMVNQFQLLELKKLQLDLYHNDIPFYRKNWNPTQNFCGFDAKAMQEIESIPCLEEESNADAIYRIGFPYNLTPTKSNELFVYGTSEYQTLTQDMVYFQNTSCAYKDLPLTIITPSNWSKVGFINAGFGEDQVTVISHGVDLSIFRPLGSELRNKYRELLGANGESFVLLSVGAMTKNKGVDILLAAYIELKKKYPQVRLVLKDQSNLYGFSANDLVSIYCKERNIDPSSKDMVDAISGIVCVTENLNLSQLNGLYNAADCYVSSYRAEGFNLPPLEAAAAGCPIVVTKGGSTDDYVDDLFAVRIESVKQSYASQHFLEPLLESLISSLTQLINHKAVVIDMKKARVLIEKNYSWSVICQELINRIEG